MTYRFIRLLVTDWKDTEAFKLGIIDEYGVALKKASELTTSEEKEAYTIFHRLIFNVKRLLGRNAFGQARLATFAAALWLVKEHCNFNDGQVKYLIENLGIEKEDLFEANEWFVMKNSAISPGVYKLNNTIVSSTTYENIARPGDKILIDEDCNKPLGSISSKNIYKVKHVPTKEMIYITSSDIERN
jgi:hypothetical protein